MQQAAVTYQGYCSKYCCIWPPFPVQGQAGSSLASSVAEDMGDHEYSSNGPEGTTLEDGGPHFEPQAEVASLPASPTDGTPDSGDTLMSTQATPANALAAAQKLPAGRLVRRAALAFGTTSTRSQTL